MIIMDQPGVRTKPIGQLTLAQLKILASVLLKHHKKVVVLLLLAQTCIVVMQEIVGYFIGLIPSHFYLVLGNYREDDSNMQFMQLIIYSSVTMVVISFIKSTNMLASGFLYLAWRERLTDVLHNTYFMSPLTTYKVNVLEMKKDNPDQRIASDADKVCYDLSQFVPVLLVSPFTIAYYTYQCWKTTGYIGPLSVLVFFTIATVINLLLMRPVAKRTYIQEQLEGDFRYNHMLVRSNCEQSAFYRVNNLELEQSNAVFGKLLNIQERLLIFKYLQSLFVNFCDYSASILSYVIIAIQIYRGRFDSSSAAELSSIISQYSFQSMYLFNCFTKLIDLAQQAAVLLGNSHRVSDFIQLLRLLDNRSSTEKTTSKDQLITSRQHSTTNDTEALVDCDQGDITSQIDSCSYELVAVDATLKESDWLVKLSHVRVTPPNSSRELIKDFTYSFILGRNVLITGPSGTGKSSLLRVIGRLWRPYCGHVTVRGDVGLGEHVCIVPQKPYFTHGNFLDQVTLGRKRPVDMELLLELVAKFKLDELYERFKSVSPTSWYDAVTPGEGQRIAVLRALCHNSLMIFLDEATSQVDTKTEQVVYSELRRRNVTYISVGHRESVKQYHHVEITLNNDCSYEITELRELSSLN